MSREDIREENIREEVVKEEEIVKETWGTMSVWKKLEYLWMYYKSWLFAAVILVGLICLGVTMYKGMHTKVLLNAVVIGGDSHSGLRNHLPSMRALERRMGKYGSAPISRTTRVAQPVRRR